MSFVNAPTPNTEAPYRLLQNRTEYQYFDENIAPIHLSKIIYHNKPLIQVFPYSYSSQRGLSLRKLKTIELRGWDNFETIPKILRTGSTIKPGSDRLRPLLSFLYSKFPELDKLIISKSDKSRISKRTITFNWNDLEYILKGIGREKATYENRRKTIINNRLSEISRRIAHRPQPLRKNMLGRLLEAYPGPPELSNSDIDRLLSLFAEAPVAHISVTENFLETRDQINVAYIDDVLSQYKKLLTVRHDNEKDWQSFFSEHGWILSNVFPYQVILRQREAYVGGKTLENAEGRVVDFLFQNGFQDNYALLEIKTHRKKLVRSTPYRQPDVFAAHDDLSGAIGQCLDQKNTFVTEMGQKYRSLDPKVVLLIGTKSELNESQRDSFELARANQKNVDIVTFDELRDKIQGLRSIIRS